MQGDLQGIAEDGGSASTFADIKGIAGAADRETTVHFDNFTIKGTTGVISNCTVSDNNIGKSRIIIPEAAAVVDEAYNLSINNYTWKNMAINLLKVIEEIRDEQV